MPKSTLLTRLQNVIDFVWENPHSDFYTTLWKQHDISTKPILKSTEDFASLLPYIDRKTLESRPNPMDRLFVSKSESPILGSTSGSSNGKPLFYWRHPYTDSYYTRLREAGSKRGLFVFNYHRGSTLIAGSRTYGLELFYIDSHQLKKAIELLHIADIDTLLVTPSIASLIPELLDNKAILQNIHIISFWGEPCSRATWEVIEQSYPRAQFFFDYDLSEMTNLGGYSTPRCADTRNLLHLNTDEVYGEIVGGELILTNLHVPLPAPLIRYMTGDSAEWITGPCAGGSREPRFRLTGRVNVDFVRTRGCELRLDLIENAIESEQKFLDPSIQVYVREVSYNEGVRAEIDVQLVKNPQRSIEEEYLRSCVISSLENNLRVSHSLILGDAIKAGLFVRPNVTFVESKINDNKNRFIKLIQ